MAYKGGTMYTEGTDRAMRFIALLATPVFALYNMLVVAGFVESSSYSGPLIAWLVSVGWVLLGAFIYFTPSTTARSAALRLTLYHALSLATLLFITGFTNPFAAVFSLLFLASHIFFGWKGLTISVASVVVAVVTDTVLRIEYEPNILLENLTGLISIVVLGGALVGIISVQEFRRQALVRSHSRERLQHERTMTIINNLTDATFSVNAKGSVLMYNAACLNLLDTNKSLKGAAINDLFNLTLPDKTPVKLYDVLKEASRATSRDDLIHTYPDGEEIRLEITFAPIKGSYDKKKTEGGYIAILRDVTKRKSLEEERDEFISVVSHELRTPITIAEGTLSNLAVILKNETETKRAALAETVDTAHDQVLYLAKMVNDLSTLSRAERGVGDDAEDMNVKDLLEDMHSRYTREARERKLTLSLDLGSRLGYIRASRLYTEELLQNFITNALKYTKEGTVTIIGRRVDGNVRFTVKDTGMGISRGDQAKIFDKFYRSEDYRIRETSGTGLGLYVSAKLARKLSTHIELTSRLNHGSSFSFELPIVSDDPSK